MLLNLRKPISEHGIVLTVRTVRLGRFRRTVFRPISPNRISDSRRKRAARNAHDYDDDARYCIHPKR